MKNKKTEMDIIYGIDDKPELSKGIPLAFQHILTMFAANITVPLLLSALLDLPPSETAFLIQCALFMAGVVVLTIGITLMPVGIRQAAGGNGGYCKH